MGGRPQHRERGIGLIEVLVAATLAILLLSLLHRFLVPVLQTNARVSVLVHLRQQATVSLEHLARDFRATSGSTISYLPRSSSAPDQPVVLALNRVESVTSSGRQLYENRVTLYVWDPVAKTLKREVWPPEPPTLAETPDGTRPITFDELELLELALTDNGTEKLLASDVEEFQPLQAWPITLPVEATLRLEKPQPGRESPAQLEIRKKLGFRN